MHCMLYSFVCSILFSDDSCEWLRLIHKLYCNLYSCVSPFSMYICSLHDRTLYVYIANLEEIWTRFAHVYIYMCIVYLMYGIIFIFVVKCLL